MCLEMNNKPKPEEITYLQKTYGSNIKIHSFEDKNLEFDWLIWHRNLFLKAEIKRRYFDENNKQILNRADILVELIQTIPALQVPGYDERKREILDYSYLFRDRFYNEQNAIKTIHQAIGWLYKCTGDRLIFFRYMNSKLYDVIDLDWVRVKSWIFNSFDYHLFGLQHSNKSTQTLNISIPIETIPLPFIHYTLYGERDRELRNNKNLNS